MSESPTPPSLARQVSTLLVGRVIAFAFLFLLPMVLARLLEKQEFGLYRQFFVLFYTLYTLMQLGMSVSLPSFVPRNRHKAREIISMTTFVLAGLGLALGLAGGLFQWVGGAHPLFELGLVLGLFSGLMVASSPFEQILLMEERSRAVAVLIVVWDLARGGFLLAVALWTRRLDLALWAMTAAAALRYLAMFAYLRRRYQIHWRRWDRPLLQRQLKETGPLTLQALAHLFEIHIDRYVVMAFFTAGAFAVYTVGAFQLPLVDMLFSSVCGVLLPRLAGLYAEGREAELHHLYKESIRRMLLVLLPLMAALFVVREELILALFSARYAESVGIFGVYLWIIPTYAALSGLIMQVVGSSRLMSLSGLAKPLLATGFVAAGLWLGGMWGVVLGLVLYHYLSAALNLYLSTLALDCSFADIFPLRAALWWSTQVWVVMALLEWLQPFASWPLWLRLFAKPGLLVAALALLLQQSHQVLTPSDRALLRGAWDAAKGRWVPKRTHTHRESHEQIRL